MTRPRRPLWMACTLALVWSPVVAGIATGVALGYAVRGVDWLLWGRKA